MQAPILFFLLLSAAGIAHAQLPSCPLGPAPADYTSTAGKQIRLLTTSAYRDHNNYHYRSVFNVNSTYMYRVREPTPTGGTPLTMELLTSDGCYIKDLWTLGTGSSAGDWQARWSRTDPKILYTWKSRDINAFNVETLVTSTLITLDTGWGIEVGPSLNGDGSRIGIVANIPNAGGRMWRSWRLSDMGDERQVAFADVGYAGCTDSRNSRYTGFQDYFVIDCRASSPAGSLPDAITVDDALGTVHGVIADGIGHSDFSPAGKVITIHPQEFHPEPTPDEPFMVKKRNIDGSGEVVLWSVPAVNVKADDGHVTCPHGVVDWCVVATFAPWGFTEPNPYLLPFDDVVKLDINTGQITPLGRTGSTNNPPGDNFWCQAQPSVAADGSRVAFNTFCQYPNSLCVSSGTYDLGIVYTGEIMVEPTLRFHRR